MPLLTQKNYLSAINNSVDSKLFQNLFAEVSGGEKDLTDAGSMSCALFVSSILMLYHMIEVDKAPHATINGLLQNMKDSGWQQVSEEELNPGDILVWVPIIDVDNKEHKHIGFYIGDESAISNSTEKRTPKKHHYKYDGKRNIESCWRLSGK